MIDKSQRPLELLRCPDDTAILGDLAELATYITSGNAQRDWLDILATHRSWLVTWSEQGGIGTGHSVWRKQDEGEV